MQYVGQNELFFIVHWFAICRVWPIVFNELASYLKQQFNILILLLGQYDLFGTQVRFLFVFY